MAHVGKELALGLAGLLPYSEWYLVMVLPYGQLDNIVNTYNRQWMGMTIGGCVG